MFLTVAIQEVRHLPIVMTLNAAFPFDDTFKAGNDTNVDVMSLLLFKSPVLETPRTDDDLVAERHEAMTPKDLATLKVYKKLPIYRSDNQLLEGFG